MIRGKVQNRLEPGVWEDIGTQQHSKDKKTPYHDKYGHEAKVECTPP